MENSEIKFYYVYLITNKILNKQYIGSRICYKDKIEDDVYWGSSKYLDDDYKIYGKENFIKIILYDNYSNIKEMLDGESFYIHKYNTFEPKGYNRYDPAQSPGWHMGGIHHSEKSKEKIKNGNLGLKRSPETKQKMRKPKSPEAKLHMSIAKKGRILSEETKQKMSKSQTGRIHSEETKQKMRKSSIGKNKGRILSEEHKEKISSSQKNHIFSLEHKWHLKEAWVKKKLINI